MRPKALIIFVKVHLTFIVHHDVVLTRQRVGVRCFEDPGVLEPDPSTRLMPARDPRSHCFRYVHVCRC